jgi:hypothetical protein
MEMEVLPERFQNIHFVNAPDIHPGDGLVGRGRNHIERHVMAFLATCPGVIENRDRDLVRFFLADMDKGARGKPRLSGPFLDQLHG